MADMPTTTNRWIGVAIDCADAGPVARFSQRFLGFEMGDFAPPLDPAGHPLCLFLRGEQAAPSPA